MPSWDSLCYAVEMGSQKSTNKPNHSFISYHQLSLAKWPQFGPQPRHKTQPFLLADQIANRNSKWRFAMQPQRNLCAWKIPKPKPLIYTIMWHFYLINRHCWIIWGKSPSELSRVGYLSFYSALSIFWVIWAEYFTVRWSHTLRKYIAYLQFGSHLFLCLSTQCMQ